MMQPNERSEHLVLTRIARTIARSPDTPLLVLTGEAGSGKTTLLRMLTSPPQELRHMLRRQPLADAAYFATPSTTYSELADALRDQLCRDSGFVQFDRLYAARIDLDQGQKLVHALTDRISGSARRTSITLVIDSLDSPNETDRAHILTLIEELTRIERVRVIASARADTRLPPTAKQHRMGRATDEEVLAYLQRRGIPPLLHKPLVARTQGLWVYARAFADYAVALEPPLTVLKSLTLEQSLAAQLERLGVENDAGLTVVCATLAAAGAGPVMPDALLIDACTRQLPDMTPELVKGKLDRLRGLTLCEMASDAEHWGLLHAELVSFVGMQFEGAVKAGHQSILASIDAAARSGEIRSKDHSALRRYAFSREAEHLYHAGRYEEIVDALARHESSIPGDNLRRWRSWESRLQACLNPEHPDVLVARSNIAHWTGEAGDATAALALFQDLLPDEQRVLGADHVNVLITRNNIASWTARTGDSAAAIALFRDLLADRQRVLGVDHPDVLTTRHHIAHWTGDAGDASEALALFHDLLLDQQRVLGTDLGDALTTRSNIASWTARTGDAATALALFRDLLADQQRVLGIDHPDVLATRNNIASSAGETGDAATALALFRGLLPDLQRVLGIDHPDVLATRNNIAHWTGEFEHAAAALALFRELLPDLRRVLGNDHPGVLTARSNIAHWTGEVGDTTSALALFHDLLPDLQRVLGDDHPHVLTARDSIASWTGETGDATSALALFRDLLPDRQRILGVDHPDVLTTRSNIASWTAEAGDAAAALTLFQDLLPDEQRVLNTDHPDVMTTRNHIAYWTDRAGDIDAALALYRDLRPDRQRVLGIDHADVLNTRNFIASPEQKVQR